jgi:type I restriction enzyme, R subunit
VSQFAYLQAEWADVYEAAARAESLARPDPRAACFYARRALELLVHWVYKHDSAVVLPYQDNLGALVHEPTFKNAAGPAVFNKAVLVTKLGNGAVHHMRAVSVDEAVVAVRELFHVGYWLAHTYAKGAKPPAGTAFYPDKLPDAAQGAKQTAAQLLKLEEQLHAKDEKLSALLADKDALDAELARLRAEIAEAKKANTAHADQHDYSEAETRDYFIDLLLKDAGWPLADARDREFEVDGMPNNKGKGYVDYVLWGDDGLPLGLVEAKRTKKDARVGQRQAELYADCLEKRFGRRPIIFYSNGYEHWLWDDTAYPPRAVQGFYKKDELELLVQRRSTRKPLAQAAVNEGIAGRYYQTRAIRRVAESFDTDKQRKALLWTCSSGATGPSACCSSRTAWRW